MISARYSDLVRINACPNGLRRLTRGRWFKIRLQNKPITLKEYLKDPNTYCNDRFWIAYKISNRITPIQLFVIAGLILEMLEGEGLSDPPTEEGNYMLRHFVRTLKKMDGVFVSYSDKYTVFERFVRGSTFPLGSDYEYLVPKVQEVICTAPIEINWHGGR